VTTNKAQQQMRSQAGRRTWGRGTIEQRGPDKWVLRISHRCNPTTGRRVRETRTVHGTRRDAERALADLIRGREGREVGPAPPLIPPQTLRKDSSEAEQSTDWLRCVAAQLPPPRVEDDYCVPP
jgi:hypothetical protein